MAETLTPWTIKQLYEAHLSDLTQCQTDFERSMATAISGKQIRESAIQWAKERKLTPVEVAIAQRFGYRGD